MWIQPTPRGDPKIIIGGSIQRGFTTNKHYSTFRSMPEILEQPIIRNAHDHKGFAILQFAQRVYCTVQRQAG